MQKLGLSSLGEGTEWRKTETREGAWSRPPHQAPAASALCKKDLRELSGSREVWPHRFAQWLQDLQDDWKEVTCFIINYLFKKSFCFCTRAQPDNVTLTSLIKETSLYNRGKILQKTTRQSRENNCLWLPNSNMYIYNTTSAFKSQRRRRVWKDCESGGNQKASLVTVCPINGRAASPLMSWQY